MSEIYDSPDNARIYKTRDTTGTFDSDGKFTPILRVHQLGHHEVTWWGMLGLISIEIVLFSGFIAGYFFLRMRNPVWPPEGISQPALLLPTINTIVLIGSSVCMYFADRAAEQDKQMRLKVLQTVSLLFGAGFLVLKYVEYSAYDHNWTTHAYSSIVWSMTAFHSMHVLTVLMKGVIVAAMAWRGMFTPERHVAVQVNGLYWHFVVVIWIPLYLTMYISPRLL